MYTMMKSIHNCQEDLKSSHIDKMPIRAYQFPSPRVSNPRALISKKEGRRARELPRDVSSHQVFVLHLLSSIQPPRGLILFMISASISALVALRISR